MITGVIRLFITLVTTMMTTSFKNRLFSDSDKVTQSVDINVKKLHQLWEPVKALWDKFARDLFHYDTTEQCKCYLSNIRT